MALLTYDEVNAISYVTGDIAVLLTPEQQSLAIQALALFNMPSLWADWEENKALIDEIVPETLLALETPQVITPLWIFRSQRIWGDQFLPVGGSAVSWSVDASEFFGGYFRRVTVAQNNELTSEFTCTPGEYRVYLRHLTTAGSGIVKIRIDGVSIGTIDLYSAATVYNNYSQSASFDITDSGIHTINLKMETKNAASANYALFFNSVDVYRIADL
jgi:hypothetical protein